MEILKLFSLFILPYSFVQPYAIRNNAAIFRNTLNSAGKTSSKRSETLKLDGEKRANTIIKLDDVLNRLKRQAGEDLKAFDGIKQKERFEGNGIAERIVDEVVESFIPALESIGPVFGSLLKPAITRLGGTFVNGAFGIAQDLLSDWNILNPETDSSFEAYPVYIPNKGSFILLTNVGLPETRKHDALNLSKINTRRQNRNIRKLESPLAAVGDNGTNFISANNTIVKNDMITNVTDFGKNKNKENIDININNNTENPNNSHHELFLTSSRGNKTDSEYKSNYDTNSIATVTENDDGILKHFTTQISVSSRIDPEDTTNDKRTMEYRSNKNASNYSNIMKIPEHNHVVIGNLTTEKSASSVVNTTEDSFIETEEEITHSTTFKEEEHDFNGYSELTEKKETKSIYLGGVHLIPLSDDILFGDMNPVGDDSAREVKEVMDDIVESQKIVKRVRKKLMLLLLKKMEEGTAFLRRRISYQN